MSRNIIVELKTEYETLTKVEKRIADFLLSNLKVFINSSITEISGALGVSQGSINNFSKKFSSGGFAALKLELAQCLSSHEPPPFAAVNPSESVKKALEIKIRENTASFRNTLEINSEENLALAARLIMECEKIEIYGVFQSGVAAKDIYYQLIRLGVPASFVDDSFMCTVSASMLNEKSVAIAVSASGRTKEILDAVELSHQSGAKVICLTGSKSSPLAKISDCVLVTPPSGITISNRATEMRLSQLFIIDALCSYIRSIIDEDGQKYYYKFQKIINSHQAD